MGLAYSFRPSRVSKMHSLSLEIHVVQDFSPLSVTHCTPHISIAVYVLLNRRISPLYDPSDTAGMLPLPLNDDELIWAPCVLSLGVSGVHRLLQFQKNKLKKVDDNSHRKCKDEDLPLYKCWETRPGNEILGSPHGCMHPGFSLGVGAQGPRLDSETHVKELKACLLQLMISNVYFLQRVCIWSVRKVRQIGI